MKEKTVKEKKKRQKISSIVKNNFYMLKLIFKTAPAYIPVTLLFSVLWSSLNFVEDAYMLRYVINGVQEGKPFGELAFFMVMLFVALIVSNIIAQLWWNVLSQKMQFRISEKINLMLFDKAAQVDLECFENPEFFDSYVKASNAGAQRAFQVLDSIDEVIWCIVTIFANSFLIFVIDPVLILFSVIPLFFAFFVKKSKKLLYDRNMEVTKNDRQMKYSLRSFYLNDFAKEMRLLKMYKVMFRQFTEAYKEMLVIYKKYGKKIAFCEFMSSMGNKVFSSLAATAYAVWQTLGTGLMKAGDCLVVVNSISQVSWIFSNSTNILAQFIEHSLYIENLRMFLNYEEKIKDGKLNPEHGTLKLENVGFSYKEGCKVLENINMEIKPGEKIALVGHNGAGKSTLVKLFLRLYDPCEGAVTFGGRNIKDYKLLPYRLKFSVVFQDFTKFSLPVKENILLRPTTEADDETVTEALKKSGGYEVVKNLKNGLDTVLTREFDDEGAVLSGGEYQKLSLARIFAEKSDIVLLDEPSSALDPIAEYNMYENMMNGCKDKAIIFISHRLSSAVLADKIYMLENGRIIEAGTHASLMAAKGKYAEMFEKQAQNYKQEAAV